MKLSADPAAAKEPWGVRAIRVARNRNRILTGHPGTIGWGGNSGFHALNLAVQFGVRRILLVGYDMRIDGGLHWHGAHPGGMVNPNDAAISRWRAALDGVAPDLAALGVEVINTSMNSALGAYPKQSLMEAMGND